MPSLKARILCTEDNTDTRELLIVLLRSAGYEVVCTDNAKEALMLAKSQRFDLYLVDGWLADSSGPTLTKWIREFDQTAPILFYSGAAHDSDLRNALNAGASGYLVKPADNAKLLSEIDRLIKSSKVVSV
jgi:DNA-binding response OmpR family regulator